MGTQIGERTNLAKVDRAALLDEAKAMALTRAEAQDHLEFLASSLRVAVDHIDGRLTAGWTSDQVSDIVLSRLSRLENGQPLGGALRLDTRRRS